MVTCHAIIVKFILALQLRFSAPQLGHLIRIVHGIILCEGRKNVTQINIASNNHRDLSCVTRFLNESPWFESRLHHCRTQFLLQQIRKKQSSPKSKRIVFLLVDDTACKKDIDTKRMDGLDFHFSHDAGKGVWSHCIVTTHIVCDGRSFAWDFRPYFREEYWREHRLTFKSKNDLAIEMIRMFPSAKDEIVHVLMDSWYTRFKAFRINHF